MVGQPVPGRLGELQLDVPFAQLRPELVDLLVYDSQDHVARETTESDPSIEAVAELRAEGALDRRLRLATPAPAIDADL